MQSTRGLMRYYGQPVGISLMNGQGASGQFCGVKDDQIQIIEYMYQDNFALKQYPLHAVRDVLPFPRCNSIPRPQPRPRPVY